MNTFFNEMHALLPLVVTAVEQAGRTLATRFSISSRPSDAASLQAAIEENDVAVTARLREALLRALPGSGWIEDEEAGGAMPAGHWWIADPVEGNVNHIHGRLGWGVTATLVQDGFPVLTVTTLPLAGQTYTAILGGGACVNGVPITVSAKTQLNAAIVGTGQARPGEGAAIYARMAWSIETMLEKALLVRMSVPTTLELLDVASGRAEGFWQYSQVRTGLASGALLVKEAGGMVTDTRGNPWTFLSEDFLAAAPGVHAAAVECLHRDAVEAV